MAPRKKRVLMLVENYFPFDIRVRNEAESLASHGYQLSVVALKKNKQKSFDDFNGIFVYRIPELVMFKRGSKHSNSYHSKFLSRIKQVIKYGIEYFYFTASCFIASLRIYFQQGFDIIHLHNPPDTLFIIGAFYKLLGKKCIFDHHDLSPELFSVKFNKKNNYIKNLLILFERLSCRTADIIICSNKSYKIIDSNRHKINKTKLFVVRNNPKLIPLSNSYSHHSVDHFPTILYIGSINPQDGVELLVESLEKLYNFYNFESFRCVIVGDGDALEEVISYAKEIGISHKLEFSGYIFDRDLIYQKLCNADICVEPAPENELNLHSTFIKIMEYMSAAKPIVAFDLKENRYSASNAAIFVQNRNTNAFALALKQLLEDESLRKILGEAGRRRIESELNWDAASKILLEAYDSIS